MQNLLPQNFLPQDLLLGWMPGPLELSIIAGIALLLFGSRVPSIMRGMGVGIKNFKDGINGIDRDAEESTK